VYFVLFKSALQYYTVRNILYFFIFVIFVAGFVSVIVPIATDVSARGPSMCLSLCMSVTLVHPAKVIRWNDLPFGRDTHVVPSN